MLFRRKKGRESEAEREQQARAEERQAAIERLKRAAEQDAAWVKEVDGEDAGPGSPHRRPR